MGSSLTAGLDQFLSVSFSFLVTGVCLCVVMTFLEHPSNSVTVFLTFYKGIHYKSDVCVYVRRLSVLTADFLLYDRWTDDKNVESTILFAACCKYFIRGETRCFLRRRDIDRPQHNKTDVKQIPVLCHLFCLGSDCPDTWLKRIFGKQLLQRQTLRLLHKSGADLVMTRGLSCNIVTLYLQPPDNTRDNIAQ